MTAEVPPTSLKRKLPIHSASGFVNPPFQSPLKRAKADDAEAVPLPTAQLDGLDPTLPNTQAEAHETEELHKAESVTLAKAANPPSTPPPQTKASPSPKQSSPTKARTPPPHSEVPTTSPTAPQSASSTKSPSKKGVAKPKSPRKKKHAPFDPYNTLLTDPEDDGRGLTGVGFEPPPERAFAIKVEREKKIREWRVMVQREGRELRLGRRRRADERAASEGLERTGQDGRKAVRFALEA